jgi:hypothetical protein
VDPTGRMRAEDLRRPRPSRRGNGRGRQRAGTYLTHVDDTTKPLMVSLNQIRLRDRRGRPTFSGVYLDNPFATAKMSGVAWAEGWSKRSRMNASTVARHAKCSVFVVRQSGRVQGSKAIMLPQHDQTATTRTFGAVVFRIAEAAFMQVSFILAILPLNATAVMRGQRMRIRTGGHPHAPRTRAARARSSSTARHPPLPPIGSAHPPNRAGASGRRA